MRNILKRSKKSKMYSHVARIIIIVILVVMLFIFVGIPERDNEAELPTSMPVPTHLVEVTPEVITTPEPIPESTPAPAPEPIPESTPAPTPTLTPTSEPTPESIPTSEPTPESIPTSEPTPESTPAVTWYYTEEDVTTMAKVMYHEARGIGSTTQIACVGWVACNRVDAGIFGDTITEVLTAPYQFAWIPNTPVEDWLVEIAEDVLQRWSIEKSTGECCGRVLPAEYLYFHGDGVANWFRTKYQHNGQYWDYSLPSPYES